MNDAEVVFFGFSFDDPFFRATLENMQQITRGRMKHQSFALLTSSPEESLRQILMGLNIKIVQYNSEAHHEEAWALLTRQRIHQSVPFDHYSESRLRQYLASVLTHLRLQQQSDLRTTVLAAATEASIRRSGGGPIESVVDDVRSELALPLAASNLIRNAISHLTVAHRLRIEHDRVLPEAVTLPLEETSAKKLDRLVTGVLARAETRYGYTPSPRFDYSPHIKEVFLRILVADGMSLAHSLVRRTEREVERVDSLVERAVVALETSTRQRIEPLRKAITSILTRPESDEETALDELAAISFVMCLTLTDPGVPGIAERIARQNVFLDASIVLPWISVGHPSEAFYSAIVESFGKPAIAEFYVNELVAHRDLATREFKDAQLYDKSRLERYALFYSLNNVNTFIGGYGGLVATGYTKSFDEYLEEVAPFRSETEAANYLKQRGLQIKTIRAPEANTPHLKRLLADKLEEYRRPRNPIRIEHDAKMVGHLVERGAPARPFFITADRSLVAAFGESQYAQVVENILFPHQAFAIAQLIGKSRGLVRGLARMVFAVGRDAVQEIKEFYIDRVLQEYEPALVQAIPEIVESIVSHVGDLRATSTSTVDDDESEVERVRRFTALDQFEQEFHTKMLQVKKEKGL